MNNAFHTILSGEKSTKLEAIHCETVPIHGSVWLGLQLRETKNGDPKDATIGDGLSENCDVNILSNTEKEITVL
jgi:hypothetical protein